MTADAPTSEAIWTELLEHAGAIAAEYRDAGWDAVVLEPVDVSPSEREERFGLDVRVSDEEYDVVETLVENEDVAFADAEVYYRPPDGDDRRYALVVERDESVETAVFLPLTYSVSRARTVLERALLEEELLAHVRPGGDAEDVASDAGSADVDRWVTFSHDDPSLFLEESDLREWSDE
ncbi:DUF7529 family protein [Natrarchaeobius oligotrophus]|uniref:Uncharacterized protein n=1 Tax=Natrarchaeobius chitinivorans TaxID=1679083 RepID=A0A3N6MH48_NATCH|nr:hypothetical protein [Natrarchaeobius chitinivorans]RQH03444.1 hypothetical protein EA472_02495 [Natrarchaeobius chitinivorans]